ncbi:MAG TPA: 16S rRNA (guanine(966)-N(2))-methyltransferase RsmD [Anaerolineales bacterium]|nr:16S rRNA (guanine(966)-N(2))-methyltransferase RsmD [Anaerolineales bacterium]HNQ94133.1 16S rRNA (guanine(966)-N(2))-methyltransferase RsmD [Anaerolineales bacterium]HNS61496.1 16S rRNA (guanine(966)-N(2))-methyltransferase RsmD [Anaerolineales bacterium]
MSLRVIAGKAKGRKLKSVDGDTTRPITDRVKEALFNIISSDVIDSNWWDLFAGTGAVGIEALSRGAASVRFTDSNRAPIDTIKSNVEHCGFAAQSEIRRADAFAYLASPADKKFEYIYIAPPQYKDMWVKALELVDDNLEWLTDDGWVIVQIAPREFKFSAVSLGNLEQFDERKYGTTLLVFYQRAAG